MLGDCLNFFSQTDLNRFYASSMAGYYPLERNAFDVERKRCQTRKLRSIQAANTILIVCVAEYNPADYSEQTESNVVDLFARKQLWQANSVSVMPTRRNIKWRAFYQRGLESA
jgi:hypothetical protein